MKRKSLLFLLLTMFLSLPTLWAGSDLTTLSKTLRWAAYKSAGSSSTQTGQTLTVTSSYDDLAGAWNLTKDLANDTALTMFNWSLMGEYSGSSYTTDIGPITLSFKISGPMTNTNDADSKVNYTLRINLGTPQMTFYYGTVDLSSKGTESGNYSFYGSKRSYRLTDSLFQDVLYSKGFYLLLQSGDANEYEKSVRYGPYVTYNSGNYDYTYRVTKTVRPGTGVVTLTDYDAATIKAGKYVATLTITVTSGS